jgi:ribonuclease G
MVLKYKRWVTIIPRDSYKYLEFKIYNADKEELMNYSN